MSASITASAPAPAGAELLPRRTGRRNAPGTLLVLAITGAVIVAAAYFSNPRLGETASGNFTPVSVDGQAVGAAPIVDSPAPDFIAAMTDGSQLQLSALRGKPVWLTFGASWCQPCRAENPDIAATYATNASKIAIVQVYMGEDATAVKEYTDRVGITYLTVPDPNEALAAQYRILGIPSHFFIDAAGVLRQVKVGSLDPATMQAALDRLGQ
ncbi:MAG: TlpA disulfide reductase family protein [Candidatus Limnocylindrales bacterium]